MPKHRVFYFVTDEEAKALELASVALKYGGLVAVEQALLRVIEIGTRPTLTQKIQATRQQSRPTTPDRFPIVRNGPWLAEPGQRTPNAPSE